MVPGAANSPGSRMFLLDTNVLAEPTRRRPNPAVLKAISQHGGQLATASVVWHELQFGIRRLPPSKRRTALETYLANLADSDLTILPYDRQAADYHASERARLQAEGRTLPFADGQIAAIAAVSGRVLVTRNPKDFQYFRGVEVVSWWSG